MWEVIQSSLRKTVQRDTTRTEFLVLTMFASNFIGIVFCRSLHFQFYCWYYHAVPFLLFQNERVPVLGKLMLFAGLEFTWSYCLDPVEGTSTPLSSIVLQITHALMLISLWYSKPVERGVVVVVKEESVKSMGSNKKKEQ
jgi:alpha-1,3-mannosyltransferase